MSVQQPADELWGAETRKAVANFPVSGERVPRGGRALARAHQGRRRARQRRARAARRRPRRAHRAPPATRSPHGRHDDQFPIDVFQTGSGTSSNMNANEVIATLAGDGRAPQRPREHGAVVQRRVPDRRPPRRARRGDRTGCCPRSSASRRSLAAKAEAFEDIVKSGRTHLMDAVPVTLGQEFAGYAAQVRLGARRVRNALPQVAQIPLGGTATGTGLNTHPEFAAQRARAARPPTPASTIRAARGPVRGAGQPRRARRALRRAQGRRRLADQDRQRPRADGLGPARGHRRAASCPSCRRAPRSCPARSTRSSPRSCSRSARR